MLKLLGSFCSASSSVLIGPAFSNAATNTVTAASPDVSVSAKPQTGLGL